MLNFFFLQDNICIFSRNISEILQAETMKMNKLIRIISSVPADERLTLLFVFI